MTLCKLGASHFRLANCMTPKKIMPQGKIYRPVDLSFICLNGTKGRMQKAGLRDSPRY